MKIWNFIRRIAIVYVRDRIIAKNSLADLYKVLGGHIYFQCLYAAIELDVFSKLEEAGSLTEEKLAERIGLSRFSTRILLLGLVSTKLLKLRGGQYSNNFVGKRALVRGNPLYIGNTVKWQHFIVYKPMFHWLESLRKQDNIGLKEFPGPGSTLYERLSVYPMEERIFQDSMTEISLQASLEFARFIRLKDTDFVVDIGGGAATNLISIAKNNSEIRGAVFDIPTVCKKAEANIAQGQLGHRLSTIEGNCFTDELPKADVFTFCHFMCIWSEQDNIDLLKKAFEALPEGGRVMIFDIMQNDDRMGPLAAAMGSPYFLGLATGRAMIYSISEYEEFCRKAGFYKTSRHALPAEHTVIVAYKK